MKTTKTSLGLGFITTTATLAINFMIVSSLPLFKVKDEIPLSMPNSHLASTSTFLTTILAKNSDSSSSLSSSHQKFDGDTQTIIIITPGTTNDKNSHHFVSDSSGRTPHPNSVESKKEQLLEPHDEENSREDALREPTMSYSSQVAPTEITKNSKEEFPKELNAKVNAKPLISSSSTVSTITTRRQDKQLKEKSESEDHKTETLPKEKEKVELPNTGVLIPGFLKIPPPFAPEIIQPHSIPFIRGNEDYSYFGRPSAGGPLSILDEFHRNQFYGI